MSHQNPTKQKTQPPKADNPLSDVVDFIATKHGEEIWVTLSKSVRLADGSEDSGFYCTLADQEVTEKAMSDPCWDVMIGSGGPGFSTSFGDETQTTSYFQSSDDGFQRIVLWRDFHGRKPGYVEVCEEFRLFHNLYLDTQTSTHLVFDDAGDEVEVVKTNSKEVKVRMSYLKAFMAATQRNLLLYFEVTRHFKESQTFSTEHQSDSLCFKAYSDSSFSKGYTSYTRVLGKKLIRCEPIEKCGVAPFERPKHYQDFAIGGDVNSPVLFNCDPDGLANYFGANAHAPQYVTPVFFKKEVMQKYYSSSDYVVNDGNLVRRGAWSLRFDNNAKDHVSLFLGDLGRDLPEKEQIYWKSFNVAPEGRTISETNYQRSIQGNFFGPENPEHRFKVSFAALQAAWTDRLGWSLFLPLADDDAHFFNSIRSMLATNEQSEFDALILALSKVTIDSINVKSLRTFLAETDNDIKSIALLERLLEKLGISHAQQASVLLRSVQSVRSAGVAHRKGTEYQKAIAKMGIEAEPYSIKFDNVLIGFVTMFDELVNHMPDPTFVGTVTFPTSI